MVDERSVVRGIGLDVHRDFCEVAIAENGRVRSAGLIATRVPILELFAASLAADDVVALEARAGADRIVAVLQQRGIQVVVANTRKLKALADAREDRSLGCPDVGQAADDRAACARMDTG
jgi:transposase